jgi:Flp pilus assembly protein TadB
LGDTGADLEMLWIFGAILTALWLVAKFLLHKGGMIHLVLMIAVASFIIQFAQDRRTKAYEKSLNR